MVDAAELRLELPALEGGPIDAICAHSKGFVAACGSVLHAYEQADDKELFRKVAAVRLPAGGSRVASLALSPAEEVLLCGLASCQLLNLPLSGIEGLSAHGDHFGPLAHAHHTGPVTGGAAAQQTLPRPATHRARRAPAHPPHPAPTRPALRRAGRVRAQASAGELRR